MEKFVINSACALKGCVKVPGAKNSALPILAASIMLEGRSTINGCPQLKDVETATQIIRKLGGIVTRTQSTVNVMYHGSQKAEISDELCKKMRSSVLFIAPLLYRCKTTTIHTPGGCSIGKRPIDIHLDGLEKMGAEVKYDTDKIIITAPSQGLKGTVYRLKLPSVGASQTLIMAASTARGITVLKGCAKEPEVGDLIDFLNDAGAKIIGKGTGEVVIEGVEVLNSVTHTLIPDRIFTATILAAVNACGGFVKIKDYPRSYMKIFEDSLALTGLKIRHIFKDTYVYKYKNYHSDVSVQTGYYPDFATDMGPILAAALIKNKGVLTLTESIFENRFSYCEGFRKLGARCEVSEYTYTQSYDGGAFDKEKDKFDNHFTAMDLRAGAALLIGAMASKGEYELYGVENIDRGYEAIEKTFNSLGANIRREIIGEKIESQ
ncbi:MAG: UDP-N-acetylglucosamine 1-carboxyvinyltransferase [Oscillospiraceae bacterium]